MYKDLTHLDVEFRNDSSIAVITIENGPYNLLSAAVAKEIKLAFEALSQEESIRAVVITGKGSKAFVAGADIKEFGTITPDKAYEYLKIFQDSFLVVSRASFPVLAAINGVALGGGCELALSCDLRIAASSARIGLPEVKVGLIPAAGGTQRLCRLIGAGLAKEMLFTGEPVFADEAKKIGLVNKVVEDGKALAAACAMAEKIAQMAPFAIRKAKAAVAEGMHLALPEALEMETAGGAECFGTEDLKEGISAFTHKRPPVFTGK